MATPPTDKFSKITIRQPKPLKRKIERAAALRGMTVTSFINGVLDRAADRTLASARERTISERDSRLLLDMLANPEGPNEALRRAAKRHREYFGDK